MVDPHFDADGTHRGSSGAEAVVDLRTQGVQRHTAFAVPLAAAHLSATKTAGALDTNAQSARLASGLNSLAHGATERDTAFELLSDGLGNQVGVELGALDLDDLDVHRAANDLGEFFAELLDLGALLANDKRW